MSSCLLPRISAENLLQLDSFKPHQAQKGPLSAGLFFGWAGRGRSASEEDPARDMITGTSSTDIGEVLHKETSEGSEGSSWGCISSSGVWVNI